MPRSNRSIQSVVFVAALTLVSMRAVARAQEPPPPPSPPHAAPAAQPPGDPPLYGGPIAWEDPVLPEEKDEDNEALKPKKKPGPGMRNAGIALTLVGVAVGAVGVAVLVASEDIPEDRGELSSSVGPLGAVLTVIGGASFVVGVPLWAVGAARYNASGRSTAGATLVVGPTSAAVQGRF
jgi:hypothetical protein